MIVSTSRRRILLLTPVLALGAVLLSNTAGVLAKFNGADRTVSRPAPAGRRQVTILGSGDIMVHPPTWAQAASDATDKGQPGFDFNRVFDRIRPAVSSADLAICHLETPIADLTEPKGFPKFYAPAELVPAVKATGYDGCTTVSNHSFDQGERGIRTTLAVLDRERLPHTGTFRTKADADAPLIYTIHGVKIANISFATMFNESHGNRRPPDKPWMANNWKDPGAVAAKARAARAAGADIVVLSVHWGTERHHEPNVDQLRLAREWTANPDIDLILGHHTHSVQPIENLNGKWVAYSMGNTLARHDFPTPNNRAGVLARFTFTEQADGRWQATRAEAIPIWLALRPTIQVINLPAILDHLTAVDERRKLYRTELNEITRQVNARNGKESGLIVLGANQGG